MLGCGMYRYGERNGVWTRWHLAPGPKDMLSQAPYKLFHAPFVSEVNYDCGQINGSWTIYDSQDRKVSEFAFEQGERQGKSIWYYPNGQKMREIDFTGGQLDGQWQEWGPGRKLTMNETYQNGRRLAKKVETYKGGQPKSESMYLYAREVLKNNYDWWNGMVTTTTSKEGKDQRHGAYISWHKNGQKDQEGQYLNDLPVGKFVWWYENGQKAIDGQFVNGERDGLWIWWHENGQKSVCGEFVKGTEIGKWTWWKEDGKVANSARITEGQPKSGLDADFPSEPAMAATPEPAPTKPTARQARGTRRGTAPATIKR
jgi:antitoxin component YwqK of YwqJK toxin-antitoxin module